MNPPFRILTGLLAGCMFSVIPASLVAEQSPIVVTATRLPTPRDEVGSSVTVITAADIEHRQYRSVTDALRSVPGLSVIPSGGGIGKLTVVFSRGTESNHTLFLIDGIELNDPAGTDGAVDLSSIYIDDVDRIEILNGPQGTLYG
ncbi:MAG: TonB-dependent receptor plug domain-containing protein, partial [Gammaproteobacteria bacterium]